MRLGYTLSNLADNAGKLPHIEKTDLRNGDWLIVYTQHSTYVLHVMESGQFEISGGWFDRNGGGPTRIGIRGCTWGGKSIQTRFAAACGLCIEFSNRVVTSPVKRFQVIPGAMMN